MPLPEFFNQSQYGSWARCKKEMKIKYVENLIPRTVPGYFHTGTAIHRGMLAGLLRKSIEEEIGKWMAEVLEAGVNEEQEAELIETHSKAIVITQRTIKQLDIGHKWGTVIHNGQPMVEVKLKVPFNIGTYKMFEGTLDWVAKELNTGAEFLVDHKGFKTFVPEEAEEWNLQMSAYQKLLMEEKRPIVGSILHQIRPEVPRQPKLNKNGTMSRADLISDWETYKAALIAAKLDPADYEEMQEKLAPKEFWRMSRAYRTKQEVDGVWEDIRAAAQDIQRQVKEGARMYRTLSSRVCAGCTVRDLCMEELRGGDVDFIRSTQFRTADEPNKYVQPEFEE